MSDKPSEAMIVAGAAAVGPFDHARDVAVAVWNAMNAAKSGKAEPVEDEGKPYAKAVAHDKAATAR